MTIDVVFAALFGLAFGSFLNVCITRLPRHESIAVPRSRCPRCHAPIPARDNIPLLSWALLRGRCRSCREKIPVRYPLVEAAVAGLFVACFLQYGSTLQCMGMAVFGWLLIGLCATDAEALLIPDTLSLTGLGLGLVYRLLAAASQGESPARQAAKAGREAVLAGAIAALTLLVIRWLYWALRRRTGLGLGDVKLFAMIAVWLGFRPSALVLFLAVVCGAAYGLMVMTLKRELRNPGPLRVPFGSFLSSAALYAMFFGNGTVDWYLGLLR